MTDEVAPITAGPLIRILADKVNQLEAFHARQGVGSPIPSDSIEKVIECIGEGRVVPDEMTIVADTALNLCRLILMLNLEISVLTRFSEFASNLLCLLLTGSYIKNMYLVKTITARSLKLMMHFSGGNPSLFPFWQCLLKIIAKNPAVEDNDRLLMLQRTIEVIGSLCSRTDNSEIAGGANVRLDPKSIQILRAAFKLSKYVLRKRAINEGQSDEFIQVLVKILLCATEEEFIEELLNLPVLSCKLKADGFSEELFAVLRRKKWPNGSLGDALRASKVLSASLSIGFEAIFTSSANLMASWPDVRPLYGSRFGNLFHVSLSPAPPNGGDLEAMLLAKERLFFLSSVLLSNGVVASREQELLKEFFLFCSIFRKIIAKLGDYQPKSSLDLFFLMSFASGKILNRHANTLLKSVKIIFETWGQPGDGGPIAVVHLIFWPLLALTNLVKEHPQPESCRMLRNVCVSFFEKHSESVIPGILMQALFLGTKYSLTFIDKVEEVEKVWKILPKLSPYLATRIFALIPLSPSLSSNFNSNSALWESLLKCMDCTRPSCRSLDQIKQCEIFLRFSTEISLFELPSLSSLQSEIINFLQRAGDTPSTEETAQVIDSLQEVLKSLNTADASTTHAPERELIKPAKQLKAHQSHLPNDSDEMLLRMVREKIGTRDGKVFKDQLLKLINNS